MSENLLQMFTFEHHTHEHINIRYGETGFTLSPVPLWQVLKICSFNLFFL